MVSEKWTSGLLIQTLTKNAAFILYRQHYQAAVVSQNPGLANPDISKIIGEQWRKLPQETKDEWKALAEASGHYQVKVNGS